MAMDLANAKTPEAKLRWAFNMQARPEIVLDSVKFPSTSYDVDHSGAIDKNEMKNVMKSIYAMVGNVPTKKQQQKDNMGLDEKVMLVSSVQ